MTEFNFNQPSVSETSATDSKSVTAKKTWRDEEKELNDFIAEQKALLKKKIEKRKKKIEAMKAKEDAKSNEYYLKLGKLITDLSNGVHYDLNDLKAKFTAKSWLENIKHD